MFMCSNSNRAAIDNVSALKGTNLLYSSASVLLSGRGDGCPDTAPATSSIGCYSEEAIRMPSYEMWQRTETLELVFFLRTDCRIVQVQLYAAMLYFLLPVNGFE